MSTMEPHVYRHQGIIDSPRNPFVGSRNDWIRQGCRFTEHRQDQAKHLLHETVEEIWKKPPNSGRYPAFVAIRWGYAEIKGNKLVPTGKWVEVLVS